MQYVQEWRGRESRKRAAVENIQENSRKRSRDDDNGRRESSGIGAVNKQEYKIRGSATPHNNNKDLLRSSSPSPHQSASVSASASASSPVAATEAPPSRSAIHPDRLANIFNAAPAPALSPAPLQNKTDYAQSPLSASPERINKTEVEEQRPKSPHSTPHPKLRIDTVRTLSSLDPRSPDYPSAMTSHLNDKSRDSPSHDPRKASIESYRPNSNPPSRRQSDVMPPPPSGPKMTRSETSTPNATSPPTNSELEPRKLSTIQPQTTLLDSLNEFAQSIMSAGSLTVRRDLTKQQAVGQQKERDRQSKFRYTFLTLIEDAESRAEGVEKTSAGIEKQIDLSSQAQSKIAVSLAAHLQKAEVPNAPPSAQGRGPFQKDFADLRADIKAAGKKLDHLNREAVMPDELHKKLRGLATRDELRGLAIKDDLRGLVTRDEVRGLVNKDELRRVTTDEVHKFVIEALVPTEKKLASLIVEDANLNQKIKGLESVTKKHHETAEERIHQQSETIQKIHQQSHRLDGLDTALNDIQIKFSSLELIAQEQQQDYAAVKVDLGAQEKALTELDTYLRRDPSNEDSSLQKIVTGNSEKVQLLQQDFERLNEAVRQIKDLQAASNTESSPQIAMASFKADASIEKEVQLIRSELDALKPEQQDIKSIRHDLDALKADQEKVVLIRTDLDSLINEDKLKDVNVSEGFEAIEEGLNKQREGLARLQNELRQVKQSQASQTVPNHPPTPPFASVSTSPRESDHQKLQDLEIGLQKLTRTTQGLELFVNSQQQKFDGLTSDRVVQSMVHQMQQMYPQHPGNLVEQLDRTMTRQAAVDSYLSGNLRHRLDNIETRTAAHSTKIKEIIQFTTESRTLVLATTNSLKQDIEKLKEGALNKCSLDHSDYGNQIDKLADRVATVEVRYVEAIADFETNQTELVRDVTNLQHRSGIPSTRNTPGALTAISRSSKSIEPNGAAKSFANVNDSDSSDTPLSQQRSARAVRQDGEERRPSNPSLKRKAVESDDEDRDEDEGEGTRSTNAKKEFKRRNISGRNPVRKDDTCP